MKTDVHFFVISRSVFLKIKDFSDKHFREYQNTHFMFNYSFSKIVP